MKSALERHAVNTQVNAFIASLNLARTEAIRRPGAVTMCSSVNPDTAATPVCSGDGHWETGWIVFLDRDGDQAYDASAGDLLLQIQGAFTKTGGISRAGTADASGLDFYPTGLLRSGRGAFRFESASHDAALQRCVVISFTGHTQTASSAACS